MQLKDLKNIPHGRILFLVDFILPLPFTALMTYLWYRKTQNFEFTLFIMLLALLFGYIVPGIGTNVLKMWTFTWKFMRAGNYFIHHGFMYAPYLAFSLYLSWGNWETLTFTHALAIAVSNTFLQCFLTTWHDYWAVKSGMIIIFNKPYREKKSAAEIIMDYGPLGYALFGLTYALSAIIAYFFLSGTVTGFILLLVAGLSMMGATGLIYVWHEKKSA